MTRGLAFAVALSIVAACACAAPVPGGRRDVVMALVSEPPSVMADDPAARIVRSAVTETLVRRDAEGRFVARLAESVPTMDNGGLVIDTHDASADGRMVATFALRADLHWQDGAPITAQDVRFAYEDDRQAAVGTERRWMADRVDAVEVLDDHHVRFAYRDGERWPLYPLAAHVLPAHLLRGASAEQRAAYDRRPVHAGAYLVSSWLPGIGMTLRPFAGYVGGPPRLDRIEVRFYRDESRVVDALRRGEVEVAPAPTIEADLTRTLDRFGGPDATVLVQYRPAMSVEVLRFGTHAPVADPLVRQALLLAVDRERLVHDLFAGRALVPRSFLVAPLDVASATAMPAPRHDTAAAAALLDQAGFTRGRFGILERGAQRMSLTLLVAAGSDSRSGAARSVIADLESVGIAVSAVERPAADLARTVASGDYDLALVPQPADDALRASTLYAGIDPWFDVLLRAAAGATGPARQELYAELQRLWGRALPGVPLYQDLRVDVTPAALAGIQPAPNGEPITWNVADWRFAADVN